ncbi:hypothetical protein BGX38DRAFT_1096186 [Terfezia claveryi]|nr:hypothetical protein BGX38DRAFT_1096186 [Terfezia claveryi]
MATKSALKAAKVCIGSKDWEGAVNNFRKVLSFEPQNYTALLYLGYALFQQGLIQESEESYNNALSVDPKYEKMPEPWQGLLNIYEAQKNIPKYIDTATKLSIIFRDGDDRTRCANVVNKMPLFVKEYGTTQQFKQCLDIVLPGSPVFEYLEGLIARPADTYLILAEMTEKEEMNKINKEIGNRSTRLGATKANVTLEVRHEVLSASPLEELYQSILNWSDNEELRRDIEGRLLQHGYEKLLVLPADKKPEQVQKVRKWAEGMVILKFPHELAWRLFIEWKDCESLAVHDVNVLREFVNFFPDTGLGEVLKAYLQSEISPFPAPTPTVQRDDGVPPTPDEIDSVQILSSMTEGLAKDEKSALCHRITGDYCLFLNEYQTAVEACGAGRKLLLAESKETGVILQRNLDSTTAILATALIHYQSPKYHQDAKMYFDGILKRNKNNITALVGLGLILQEQGDHERALEFLMKALKLNPDSTKILSEASWCRVLMQDYEGGEAGLEECLEKITGVDAQARELKAQVLWRIGTCIWNADAEEARSDRKGAYSYFMRALQSNSNYAPAYTSMGIYYADIAGDVIRATKCFEKAFELSPGEIEAAERLARMFADTREWDLVEIIARRVADADKKRSITGMVMSWPQNAIGMVELNAQNHAKAVVAFQSALRSTPTDLHSWFGLGEAYANSGKYNAALKSFQRAAELDDENWLVKYMIANVHRELGEFTEACSGYREVLEKQPEEFGVLMALAETLLAMAHNHVENGYYGQAADALLESLKTSKEVVTLRAETLNIWKNVGDACLLFSWIQSLCSQLPLDLVKGMISLDIDKMHLNIMSEYDRVDSTILDSLTDGDAHLQSCLYLGILSYKRALYVSADDRYAHSVAWFNLGCAEFRAYNCGISQKEAHHSSAIRCFKRAIKVEPGNHDFWNALGVVTADRNPRASQHALVRSLYINGKDARVWTNLGTLYLLQHDVELASEAFTRAQSVDPEYANAWIGQGLISVLGGEFETAQELFEHAFEISDGFATISKREYATSTFDTRISVQPEASFISLIGPIFALHKLELQMANQPALLHLSALLQERIGEFNKGAANLSTVCDVYEQRYEDTEAEEDLVRYAQSKGDLARMMLGQKEYDEAIEHASIALDLSAEIELLKPCRLSAHLTCGLANYFNGEMSQSLEMFKVALEESSENADVVTLLAQVLWAKGGEDEKETAREQLFTCIENHPDHLHSMLLLGSIGVLDQNEDILEAVMGDLYSVRGNILDLALMDKVDNILNVVAHLQNKDPIPTAATAVFLGPAHPGPWQNFAAVAVDQHAADMAKEVAEQGDFDPEVVADALAGVGQISCDQRAIMIAPWRASGWKGLAADIVATT